MDLKAAERAKRRLTWTASVATAGYLTVVGYYTYIKWEKIIAMEPNNVGDFLAGAFGPLALFWFVVGYFQQGQELSQNTQALLLQHQEMQASVQQATELVTITKRDHEVSQMRWEADLKRRSAEIQVQFKYATQTADKVLGIRGLIVSAVEIQFLNLGGEAVNVNVRKLTGMVDIVEKNFALIEFKGALPVKVEWDHTAQTHESEPVTFAISYEDRHGDRFDEIYSIVGDWTKGKMPQFVVQRERIEILLPS